MPTPENMPPAPETQPAPPSSRAPAPAGELDLPPFFRRPFVGAHVLYAMHRDTPCQGELRPARVVRAFAESANLVIDLDGANDSPTYDPAKSPPTLHRSGVPHGLGPGQWCWPEEVPPTPAKAEA